MRIEDLDAPRVVAGSAQAICADHTWLGLDWDEGPVLQSERESSYLAALSALDADGHLYPCTCSRKDIAAIASAPHGDMGPRYPGTCRAGATRSDRAAAIRFRMPDEPPVFDDRLYGSCGGEPGSGDFVVRRADGVWAYQLAVVLDDAEMGITEVIRGADLLSSTPAQISLYRALGHDVPEFFHVPLVIDLDGRRLSKRYGAVAIDALREQGVTPAHIIGALAHSLGITKDPAPIDLEDLLSGFDPELIDPEPSSVAIADLFV